MFFARYKIPSLSYLLIYFVNLNLDEAGHFSTLLKSWSHKTKHANPLKNNNSNNNTIIKSPTQFCNSIHSLTWRPISVWFLQRNPGAGWRLLCWYWIKVTKYFTINSWRTKKQFPSTFYTTEAIFLSHPNTAREEGDLLRLIAPARLSNK